MRARASLCVVVRLFVNDGVRVCERGHEALLGRFDGADVVVVSLGGGGGGASGFHVSQNS